MLSLTFLLLLELALLVLKNLLQLGYSRSNYLAAGVPK
jgi:hypothetical protein